LPHSIREPLQFAPECWVRRNAAPWHCQVN
jgi:hypothetical protein